MFKQGCLNHLLFFRKTKQNQNVTKECKILVDVTLSSIAFHSSSPPLLNSPPTTSPSAVSPFNTAPSAAPPCITSPSTDSPPTTSPAAVSPSNTAPSAAPPCITSPFTAFPSTASSYARSTANGHNLCPLRTSIQILIRQQRMLVRVNCVRCSWALQPERSGHY